jgi:hypothetical protein
MYPAIMQKIGPTAARPAGPECPMGTGQTR